MQKEEIALLVHKYLNDTATAEERAALQDWYESAAEENQTWFAEVRNEETLLKVAMYSRIARELGFEAVDAEEKGKLQLWPRIRIAVGIAAAVATIAFGVWFFTYREVASSLAPRNDDWAKNDVAPGRNGATITLGSGEVIALSDTRKGVVIGDGSLTYDDGSEIASQARNDGQGGNPSSGVNPSLRGTKQSPVEMTASTAKGQTYEFTLSDGTRVWLNADSKISFPSQFSGKERKILMSGEAYFEVAKNKARPFIAIANNQEVEVLGTHFNISSYSNEASIKTTLLEGSVRINKKTILKPGEQSAVDKAGSISVAAVDVEKAVAWKNGKFVFRDENIASVMRKLERWYNVEVIYQGDFSNTSFTGSISRGEHISKILDKISYINKVHFKVSGRRIYVMP